MGTQPHLRVGGLAVHAQQPLALAAAQDNTAVHGSASRVIDSAPTTLTRAAFCFKRFYLVVLAALRDLNARHPDVRAYHLNCGAMSGHDILSDDRRIVAEAFAAVRHDSNRKLGKDVDKLAGSAAAHRYVYFHSPAYPPGRYKDLERDGVIVICVALS